MTVPAHLDHITRLVATLKAGTTDMAETISTVPLEEYRSPERFAAERATVFRKLPIIAASSDELRSPGDCLTHDVLGAPVVLVRGEDRLVRGFLNVCRHRNTRIVSGDGVQCLRALKCPYHNWVYGLDGALNAVPQAFGFPGLDREKMGLVPVPVAERHGLIWLIADPMTPMDLDAHLAGVGADLDAFGFDEHVLFRRARQRRKTNWKLVADAFLEAYHVQRLHRDTVAAFFTDNELCSDRLGPHVRSAIARKATDEVIDRPVEEWRIGDHMTFAYYIFPCTVLVVQPDFQTLLNFVPVAVDETEIDHIMLIPQAPQNEDERAHFERAFDFMDSGVFNGEDVWVAEQAQSVIDAGANEVMTLGTFEHGVKFFHDTLEAAIGELSD
ncbi:MAG: aromatic ring-hydroxylating dioxygenase subunit alpha [Alphaproteobacteria bacterium]|nr:aromatic ring-hydroxylating dioxygenase subunit alpha [Alphaproteobacteria bacterium]